MLSLSHDYTKPKTDVESQRTKKREKKIGHNDEDNTYVQKNQRRSYLLCFL